MLYSADFETIVNDKNGEKTNATRVWAYAIIEVGNDKNFYYGNNIDDFMKFCEEHTDSTFYFHNLKFDGEFILYWLFTHGFEWTDANKLKSKQFKTLISEMGAFYCIEVCFGTKKRKKIEVKFYDSMKIFNMSVADLARGFGMEMSKLEIDYEEYREEGHILTQQEIDYIHNDVAIVAKALEFFILKEGYNKMTIGSNAIEQFKNIFGKKNFSKVFPNPERYDKFIRSAYKGGFCYVNKEFIDKDIGQSFVLDVNSLYPWAMWDEQNLYPYGEPLEFNGKYEEDKIYNLYIQKFRCNFKLKKNHIPCVQQRHGRYAETEYLESSKGEDLIFTMTSVDLELFFEQYDVYNIEWLGGFKFKSKSGFFTKYIDKYSKMKIDAKAEHNKALYLTAKMFLNNLYGKFATNPITRQKIPYLNDEGIIKYKFSEEENLEPVYIPVACFVTSYARRKTITSAQKIEDNYFCGKSKMRFLYADTDSLHISNPENEPSPEYLDIDDYKLGAWKREFNFIKARYLRPKCYIEFGRESEFNYNFYDDSFVGNEELYWKKTIAGANDKVKENINWDNFHKSTDNYKAQFEGKLRPTHIKGGIVLKDTVFTIRK